MIILPTESEPVNVTMSTAGCVVINLLASRSPVTTLMTPGGNPTSSQSAASHIADSGVNGDGFKTTVFPAATDGAIFMMCM